MPTIAATEADMAVLREVSLRLARRLRRYAGTGLTVSQMSALTTVERHGCVRLGDLARRELVGKSSVTRTVSRLEQLGYVLREVDEADGRSCTVALTDKGRDLLWTANAQANAQLAQQFHTLPEVEQQAIQAALPGLARLVALKP